MLYDFGLTCSKEYNTPEYSHEERKGESLNKKYSNCMARTRSFVVDGQCDHRSFAPIEGYNNEKCSWDTCDCIEISSKYPYCSKVDYLTYAGNGKCDGEE